MVLTVDQKSAIRRGEAVSIHFPDMDQDCIVMNRESYLALIKEEQDMELARQHTRETLTQSKLALLAKQRPPAASWYEEDHTGLYDASTS